MFSAIAGEISNKMITSNLFVVLDRSYLRTEVVTELAIPNPKTFNSKLYEQRTLADISLTSDQKNEMNLYKYLKMILSRHAFIRYSGRKFKFGQKSGKI